MSETQEKQTKQEFEDEMASKAESQNLPEGAVPEQRPQAMVTDESPPHSDLTQKLYDEEVLSDEPMDKAAYDRAASDSQAKKAAKESFTEGIMVGNVVKATKGPHEGRTIAVTRITRYRNRDDQLKNAVGSPEQLYVLPDEIEGRARGDERDGEVLILNVDENGLEKVRDFRGVARG